MKVIEKLFVNYIGVHPENYVLKITSGISILSLANNELRKNYLEKAKKLSEEFPFSVYRAITFVNAKESKLVFTEGNKRVTLDKTRGDDHKIREQISYLIEDLDKDIMNEMNGYNTDRARQKKDSDFDFKVE